MNEDRIKALRQELTEVEEQIKNQRHGPEYHDSWENEIREYRKLSDRQDELRRNISLLQGLETAVLLDWQHPWDVGVPIPHVVSSDLQTFLIYRLWQMPDPDWDGQTVRIITANEPDPIAVVAFFQCCEHRFGRYFNEDNLDVHPLAERGLVWYKAHEIVNSQWIEELKQIDAKTEAVGHGVYNEDLKHYFFAFHDNCFECVATGYSVEVVEEKPFCDVVLETTRKLFEH